MNYEYANATDEQIEQWEFAAAEAAADDAEWEREQAQTRWAEAGGYRAGIPRPAY